MAMKKKNKSKVDRKFEPLAPKFDVKEVIGPPKFDVDEIAKRLRFIDVPEFIHGIFDAIDEAKGMTGALPPDECDTAREELEQLRKTVAFVFGAERADG